MADSEYVQPSSHRANNVTILIALYSHVLESHAHDDGNAHIC